MSIAELYLERTGQEYRQAFNAAAGLASAEEPILAVISSTAHGIELLRRFQQPLYLTGSGQLDINQFCSEARGWNWGPVFSTSLTTAQQDYTAILWAEPEQASARAVAGALRQLASPQSRLAVISTSFLRAFLPDWRSSPKLAQAPVSPGALNRLLRQSGWQVTERYGFHGPRAIFWGCAMRLALLAGRPDLGDRCTFAARAAYCEAGALWVLAPVVLLTARPC